MAFDLEQDIAELICTSDAGYFTLSDNVFGSELPSDPDNCIAVKTSPVAKDPQQIFDQQQPAYFQPRVIIYIRHLNYTTALTWISEIKKIVVGKAGITLNNNEYLLITQVGDVHDLDRDLQRRYKFSLNLQIIVNPTL